MKKPNFIEKLFIKKRMKDYTFMRERALKMSRYVVVDLWNGKFYHTLGREEVNGFQNFCDHYNYKYIIHENMLFIL